MIPFEDQINSQLKEAMRAKQKDRLEALRSMKSAIKYKLVEKSSSELSETEVLEVFQKLAKQRQESIEQFEKAGRAEAAQKEKNELVVIQSFFPEALSESDLKQLISEAIQSSGASSPKDMGLVMKELKPKITGRADAKTVSQWVKASLEAL